MTKEKKKEVVRKSRLFLDFTPEDFQELDARIAGKIKKYRKGDIIVGEGDPIKNVSLIMSGEVDVIRLFSEGEFAYVNKLKKNNTIGMDVAYRVGHNSYYFYKAATDVELYNIPLTFIRERGHLSENLRVKLMTNILIILTHENIRNYNRLDILSTKSLRERIRTYLFYQSKKNGSKTFTIPFSREEMADFLCVNRSALSKELSRMKNEGIIDYHRNEFTIF